MCQISNPGLPPKVTELGVGNVGLGWLTRGAHMGHVGASVDNRDVCLPRSGVHTFVGGLAHEVGMWGFCGSVHHLPVWRKQLRLPLQPQLASP